MIYRKTYDIDHISLAQTPHRIPILCRTMSLAKEVVELVLYPYFLICIEMFL